MKIKKTFKWLSSILTLGVVSSVVAVTANNFVKSNTINNNFNAKNQAADSFIDNNNQKILDKQDKIAHFYDSNSKLSVDYATNNSFDIFHNMPVNQESWKTLQGGNNFYNIQDGIVDGNTLKVLCTPVNKNGVTMDSSSLLLQPEIFNLTIPNAQKLYYGGGIYSHSINRYLTLIWSFENNYWYLNAVGIHDPDVTNSSSPIRPNVDIYPDKLQAYATAPIGQTLGPNNYVPARPDYVELRTIQLTDEQFQLTKDILLTEIEQIQTNKTGSMFFATPLATSPNDKVTLAQFAFNGKGRCSRNRYGNMMSAASQCYSSNFAATCFKIDNHNILTPKNDVSITGLQATGISVDESGDALRYEWAGSNNFYRFFQIMALRVICTDGFNHIDQGRRYLFIYVLRHIENGQLYLGANFSDSYEGVATNYGFDQVANISFARNSAGWDVTARKLPFSYFNPLVSKEILANGQNTIQGQDIIGTISMDPNAASYREFLSFLNTKIELTPIAKDSHSNTNSFLLTYLSSVYGSDKNAIYNLTFVPPVFDQRPGASGNDNFLLKVKGYNGIFSWNLQSPVVDIDIMGYYCDTERKNMYLTINYIKTPSSLYPDTSGSTKILKFNYNSLVNLNLAPIKVNFFSFLRDVPTDFSVGGFSAANYDNPKLICSAKPLISRSYYQSQYELLSFTFFPGNVPQGDGRWNNPWFNRNNFLASSWTMAMINNDNIYNASNYGTWKNKKASQVRTDELVSEILSPYSKMLNLNNIALNFNKYLDLIDININNDNLVKWFSNQDPKSLSHGIFITDRQNNDAEGTITFRIDATKDFNPAFNSANNIGVVDWNKSPTITFRGFRTQDPTLYTNSTYVNVSGVNSTFTTDVNQQQVQEMINNNINDYVINPVINQQNTNQNTRLEIVSYDNTSYAYRGVIKLQYKIINYYNNDGNLTTSELSPYKTIYLNGYKTYNTEQKLQSLSYNSTQFKEIFGSNGDYQYQLDWNSANEATIKSKLNTYFNNHKDILLAPLPPNSRIDFTGFSKNQNNIVATISTNVYKNGVEALGNYSLTFELRTLPSANTGDNTNVLRGFQDFLQAKISSETKIFPDITQLTNYVCEFLNQPNVKSQLPMKFQQMNFNSNDIRINYSNISKQNNEMTIHIGDISINAINGYSNKIDFPQTIYNCAITSQIITSISADDTISNLNPSIIASGRDEPGNQKIHRFIDKNRNNIFSQLPEDTVIGISYRDGGLVSPGDNTQLKVTLTIGNWYNVNEILWNVEKTLVITGFRPNNLANTTINLNDINANEAIFNQIWANDKGFYTDWVHDSNLIVLKQNALKDYINRNHLFINETPGAPSQVSSVELTNGQNNSFVAIITFNGMRNDIYNPNLTQNITINLKPDPNQSGSNSTLLSGLEPYIQNWINNNHQFPNWSSNNNPNQLVSILADYLNTAEAKAQMPNCWIPNGGFTKDNSKYTIYTSTFTKNDGWPNAASSVSCNESSIKFQNALNNEIAFSAMNWTVPTTYQISSAVSVESTTIANLIAPNIISNAHGEQAAVINYLQSNIRTFFDNVNPEMTITNPRFELISNSRNIKVTFDLRSAYGIDGWTTRNDIVIQLNNFNANANNNTTINLPDILTWNQPEFKTLFNDNGYTIDWTDVVIKNTINTHFKKAIETGAYIVNPISETIPSLTTNIEVNSANNTATATVTFKGLTNGIMQDITKTINLTLRPTPNGTNIDANINPLVGFERYLQNQVDTNYDHTLPNDQQLAQIAADFLNSIKDQLPHSCLPNNDTNFNSSNIHIDSSLINKTTSPIIINAGAISTTGLTNSITFPPASINVYITAASNIQAGDPIRNYYASVIISTWNSNRSDPMFQAIKDWINSNITSIFNPLPTSAQVIEIINITNGSNSNSISIEVKLDKAYTSDQGIAAKNFTFEINYFNSNYLSTTLNVNPINYDSAPSSDFQTIFGPNDKGFAVDWNYNKASYETKLVTYINNHKEQYFSNSIPGTKVISATFNIDNNTGICKVNLKYYGLNDLGDPSDQLTSTTTINLRLVPGSSGSVDNNLLAGFQDYLQKEVSNNGGVFPDDNKLAAIASDYLNSIKDQLPDACIPTSGSFNASNITIDPSKIHKNNNPVTLDKGAIITNTTPGMAFPALSINVAITSINSPIQATNPIASYNASEIINLWQNNNRNDPKIIAIKTWINDPINQQRIFNHLPANAQVNEITNITSGLNDNNSLNISVKLSQAFTNNGLENDVIFNNLLITGFNSSFTATTLKINSLRYDETLFKTIFGADDKGFVSDWQHSIATKQEQLHQNIVNNLSNWFNTTPNTNINVSPINIEITPSNEAIATFTYSGFNSQGQYVNNLSGQITIFLRSNPDFNNPNDVNNPLKDFNQWLQNKIDTQPSPNNGVWPSDSILKQWISDYLNTKKSNLPNTYIPNSGSFNSSDITIDPAKINKTKNPIILEPGAISTTNTQEKLPLPQANITVKETTLKNAPDYSFSVSSELGSLRIADIIHDFQTNGTNGTLVIKIQTWINSNLINIFNNLVQPTPSATINNITTSLSNNQSAIDVSITLSQAYTTNGIASKEFSFTLTGFNNSVQNDTTLKITQINYNDSLFGEIFTNKQIFAIDWACLTSVQIQQKCSELSSYMSSHLDVFFSNPNTNEPANIVINEQGIDFSNITNNIIVVNITFNGYKNNIAVSNITGSITINLKSINNISNDIYPSINDALSTIIQSSNKLPTQEEINKIVVDTINQNPTLLGNIPDIYLDKNGLLDTNNIIIDPSKITLDGNKVIIDPGLIALKPNPDKITNLNPHWTSGVNDILIPDQQQFIIKPDVSLTNNNDWWIWVVIAAGVMIAIVLIILLVVYILKAKRNQSEFEDL